MERLSGNLLTARIIPLDGVMMDPEELQAKLISKSKQCELIEVAHTDLPELG